ncbi:uncharacterized protein BCR38DRAFT_412327 [Pseudomassariella vexata]|uniref:Uncharacterized protein n=1 Tax=Pseudomassariella vexata TaxID=1141098 RepID=A0A1Y2DLJ7_9PEZI|nr:uncharacterized protein BCR38DRAFT_412327 [Pseudomassariella vexata]ORY60130.1 hypothetical protein BCR38DRAFT_412327 [Pseudomassariella vexata]
MPSISINFWCFAFFNSFVNPSAAINMPLMCLTSIQAFFLVTNWILIVIIAASIANIFFVVSCITLFLRIVALIFQQIPAWRIGIVNFVRLSRYFDGDLKRFRFSNVLAFLKLHKWKILQ